MFDIPLSETTLDEEEVEAATRVLRSKWLTLGSETAAFEEEFAAALGARHAVAVSNGTVALEIVYRAAGITPGDEIIMPSITFIACYNAAKLVGAKPVIADITSEDDWTLSVADLARKIAPKTRAVVSMPHGGFCPDMEGIVRWTHKRGLMLFEDACHAPLAELAGRKIGTFGLAATWSFFGNKNMTTGEGGMITTDDEQLAAKCRLLRSHGITKTTWDRAQGHAFSYDVACVGMNARMDEVRAAIGRVQLRKLPAANASRARAAERLRQSIAEIPGITIPYTEPRGTSAHHLFCVLLPEGTDRHAVMTRLKEAGIQTSIHYPPLNSFSSTRGDAVDTPVADRVAPRILTLPLFPQMTEEQCLYTAKMLGEALGRRKLKSESAWPS